MVFNAQTVKIRVIRKISIKYLQLSTDILLKSTTFIFLTKIPAELKIFKH